MIDFKELPEDGIKFEQLIRELLVLEGFETHWTGVGQDGGRDLIVMEKLKGRLSTCERKWLISCKHTANSGKSLGRDKAGNISEDCYAINAKGYILVCSTQPSSALVDRLDEIQKNKGIITRYWDSIEIENRLSKPNTFKLIHIFFPKSAQNYQWKIYNTFSPSFWAANYKDYFMYLSCRLSNSYPYLESIETIVCIMEKISIFKDEKYFLDSHYLRLRAVYYDDKFSYHTAYIDYLYPDNSKNKVIYPQELQEKLLKAFGEEESKIMNPPRWDIKYQIVNNLSDNFDIDHKKFYEAYRMEFEHGIGR